MQQKLIWLIIRTAIPPASIFWLYARDEWFFFPGSLIYGYPDQSGHHNAGIGIIALAALVFEPVIYIFQSVLVFVDSVFTRNVGVQFQFMMISLGVLGILINFLSGNTWGILFCLIALLLNVWLVRILMTRYRLSRAD